MPGVIWDLVVIIILSAILATHLWSHRCCERRIQQLVAIEGAIEDEMYAAVVVVVNMNTADDADTGNEDGDGNDSNGGATYSVKPTSIDPRLEAAYRDCSLRFIHIRSVRSANLVAAAVCAVCVSDVGGMLALSWVTSISPLAKWAVLAVLMPVVHFVSVLRDVSVLSLGNRAVRLRVHGTTRVRSRV